MNDTHDEHVQLRAALAVDVLEQAAAAARIGGALFGSSPIPPRLGAYVLLDRIGAGAHGVVYSAYHRPTRRQVALKVLAVGRDHADALHEARALARVNHPNVVAVFEAGSEAGRSFIAMQWVMGPSLASWLASEVRSRRDVLRVFAQAAWGLAAAHDAGVIHRDFKPANVLVGDDGRTRVGDFGLAVAHDEALGSAPAGTPAYMAPELLRGAPADARSDQFAFFVALHEALLGRRPSVDGAPAIGGQSSGAARRSTPRSERPPRLPPALRRGIARGLAADPAARHADMRVVAGWLEAAVPRRRTAMQWIAAVAVSGTVAAAVVAPADASPCSAPSVLAAELWPAATRRQVVEAVEAAAASSPGTGARVGARLDAWLEQWSRLQHDACLARRDPTANADAMACLRAEQREFEALVGVLAEADATIARHAVDAAAALGRPGSCMRADERVSEALAPTLATVDALRVAGKPAQALALAEASRDDAQRGGSAIDLAAANVALGRAAEDAGELELAATTLHDAFLQAYALRADALAATAAIRLIYVEGYALERRDRGRAWHRAATALQAERGLADADAAEVADLLANVGAMAEASGDHELALTRSTEALQMRERLFAAPHPDLARAHNNLGVVLVGLGRYDDAIAAHRRALEQRRELYGDRHPSVATSLLNLGFVHLRTDEIELAYGVLRESLEIRVAALGPRHPDVASSWANLATALEARGDATGAIEALGRAIEIGRRAWGEDHERVASLRDRIGVLARAGVGVVRAQP